MRYEAAGRGCYMFRIDDDVVIDATMRGNNARFVNHCCEPNCDASILRVDGSKRLVMIALRDLQVGDEITYDYKFTLEAEEHRIRCLCRTASCRKWLNWAEPSET
eukprot:GFYU01045754.1.p1 GENE.GFYU01045754.1~~GFYU01045754.1.p1  ORF type:complete len:105 (-),score=17.17 GFYU01045754.1:26-340(-)